MKPVWRRITAAFLLGCLLGAFLGSRFQRMAYHRYWEHGPDTHRYLRRLTKELSLNDQQQRAAQEIVERYREQVQLLHQDTTAKLETIRLSMRSEISKLLTPDQQKKFEDMIARFERRHSSSAVPKSSSTAAPAPPQQPPGPSPAESDRR